MVQMRTFLTKEEWLKARKEFIGGSDAAAILGLNPWKSNTELWEEKTGRKEAKDLSRNSAVTFGTNAESHLRELFRLDFPELKVMYIENNLWVNDLYPFSHASLDGWMTDEEGRQGILEIKTASIQSQAQADKWKGNSVPDYYYCQLLHYLAVTDFSFVILKARLKYDIDGKIFVKVKHYRIEKTEVMSDIDILMDAEKTFFEYIKEGVRPPLTLPNI